MDWLTNLLRPLDTLSQIPLYSVGKTTITLGTVLYLTILVVALFYATAKLKTLIVERLLSRSHVDLGVRHAIGTIVRYIVVAIGLVIILQTAGINLSTLTVLFGALGIGVGFGLQSITNNFVSGISCWSDRSRSETASKWATSTATSSISHRARPRL